MSLSNRKQFRRGLLLMVGVAVAPLVHAQMTQPLPCDKNGSGIDECLVQQLDQIDREHHQAENALAQSKNAPELDCNNPQTEIDIQECLSRKAKTADWALNETYRFLIEHSDKGRIFELRRSQRAWVQFRDANCRLASDRARGGTMSGSLYAKCLEQMTLERTKELEQYLNDTRGLND